MKYDVIYADPPWSYSNKKSNGAADTHYETMRLADLKAMPVADIAADSAVLFMWWTPPLAKEAIALVEAWGFTLKNMCAFTWCKLNQNAAKNIQQKPDAGALSGDDMLRLVIEQTAMGLGNYTRSNAESCLVAIRGPALERASKSVKQMILAPLSRHSAKPPETRDLINQLYPQAVKLEMFARTSSPGWHTFGNDPAMQYNLSYDGTTFSVPQTSKFSRAKRKPRTKGVSLKG